MTEEWRKYVEEHMFVYHISMCKVVLWHEYDMTVIMTNGGELM